MKISEAKVKKILQTILEQFESDICYDNCFYDFDSTSEAWDKITELITEQINETLKDIEYYKGDKMTITEFLEENKLTVNDLIVYKKLFYVLNDSCYALGHIIGKERDIDKRIGMLISLFKDYDLKIVNSIDCNIQNREV